MHILSQIMWYFDKGIETFDGDDVNICADVAKSNLDLVNDEEVRSGMEAHLNRVLKTLKSRKTANAEKYAAVEI